MKLLIIHFNYYYYYLMGGEPVMVTEVRTVRGVALLSLIRFR